jgi:hypothetical protein
MGQQPVLSLAAPAALAIAASTLCLAVVYTVDWSPTTRIKGVVMMVGLAYFAGLSLYFLKKDMVDRVKVFFGQDREWKEVSPPGCQVTMPRNAKGTADQPLPGWTLTCFRGSEKSLLGDAVFLAGAGADPKPDLPDDQWFEAVGAALARHAGRPGAELPFLNLQGLPAKAWDFEFRKPNGVVNRMVHVYRGKGTVYFLSAEGPNLGPDDDQPRHFFESFKPSRP